MGSDCRQRKVAIVGCSGVPARYGGYETLAQYLVENLHSEFRIVVYCSKDQKVKGMAAKNYLGARLKYLPLSANGWQSVIYDSLSTLQAFFIADVILILGPAAGFLVPLNLIFRKKVIVNHGGLNEWEREKFSLLKRLWAKLNHGISAKFSTCNIADNRLLKDSLKENFSCDSEVIRYGGNHARKVDVSESLIAKYSFLKKQYAVSVSRAQVDNNLHLVLEAFEKFTDYPLVLISNWNISSYGEGLREKYRFHPNIILLDAIYDSDELNAIRGNSFLYIHTHSRCGTAPSLVEAMSLNIPVVCFDVPTNRETTQDKSVYFNNSDELLDILTTVTKHQLDNVQRDLFDISQKEYTWQYIAGQYGSILRA
mgnify:CR=1 FL=1